MLKFVPIVIVGTLFIMGGLVGYFVIAAKVRAGIEDKMVIDSPDHKEYTNWLSTMDPDDSLQYQEITVFNLTNPAEFLHGSKPILAEVGPFVYRRHYLKDNVTFVNDSTRVRYTRTGPLYTYEPTLSAANWSTDSDATQTVYAVNLFYIYLLEQSGGESGLHAAVSAGFFQKVIDAGAASLWGSLPLFAANGLDGFAKYYSGRGGYTLSSQKSAALLTAFSDPVTLGTFLVLVQRMSGGDAAAQQQYAALFSALALTSQEISLVANYVSAGLWPQQTVLLQTMSGTTYGPLITRFTVEKTLFGPDPILELLTGLRRGPIPRQYSRAEGEWTVVRTGKDDLDFAGMDYYEMDLGVDTIPYPTPLKVRGRKRSYEPFSSLPHSFDVWFESGRRPVRMTNPKDVLYNDVECHRYEPDPHHATAVNSDLGNTIRGFMNIRWALNGAPIYFSFPHFSQDTVDPEWIQRIEGLHSNETERYKSFGDVEPTTGIMINGARKVQYNTLLNRSLVGTLSAFAPGAQPNLIMLPILWGNERGHLSAKDYADLRLAVVTARIAGQAIIGVLVSIGILLLFLGVVLMARGGPAVRGVGAEDEMTPAGPTQISVAAASSPKEAL